MSKIDLQREKPKLRCVYPSPIHCTLFGQREIGIDIVQPSSNGISLLWPHTTLVEGCGKTKTCCIYEAGSTSIQANRHRARCSHQRSLKAAACRIVECSKSCLQACSYGPRYGNAVASLGDSGVALSLVCASREEHAMCRASARAHRQGKHRRGGDQDSSRAGRSCEKVHITLLRSCEKVHIPLLRSCEKIRIALLRSCEKVHVSPHLSVPLVPLFFPVLCLTVHVCPKVTFTTHFHATHAFGVQRAAVCCSRSCPTRRQG